jgi:hypothetical protein
MAAKGDDLPRIVGIDPGWMLCCGLLMFLTGPGRAAIDRE